MRAEGSFVIRNKFGLHARAAAQIVSLAAKFGSDIKLEKDEMSVNGKSIMGVMMLAAAQGSKLMVIAEGDDAQEALEKIGELINNGFGEEE